MFAKRNKAHAPAHGIIIGSVIMSLFLLLTANHNLVDQFQFIILVTTAAFLVTYFYTAISQIIILKNSEESVRKNVINIVIASLAACYAFWAIFGSGKNIIFYLLMFLFACIPLYVLMNRQKKN
jgi:amino acid transporter